MKEIGTLHWIKSIEGLNFIKGNRCFIEDEKEAIEEGFTMKQIKRLQARIKKLGTMKCFEKFGWMEEHPLIVYVLDGKKYLGDGQGRGLYTTAYNANISEEIRRGNATEDNYILIPVREYEVDSYQEMLGRVIVQNQYGVVWTKMEQIQAECEASGDKDITSGWNLVKRYSDELNIAESVASDALFGQGSTKKDTSLIRISHQRPYARQYLKWLGELYKECEKVGWNERLLRRIHGTKSHVILDLQTKIDNIISTKPKRYCWMLYQYLLCIKQLSFQIMLHSLGQICLKYLLSLKLLSSKKSLLIQKIYPTHLFKPQYSLYLEH